MRSFARRTAMPGRRLPAPPRIASPLPGSFGASGAVGPGGGAARLQQRGGAAVLLGLGRLGRIAGAAHRAPGGARELVLAAVAAVGRDRGRVAARLALRRSARARSRRTAAGACEALRPSAASVCGPTTPSTVSPCARWKRRTALRVCGPNTPSALTPSARWSAATSTPGATARAADVDVDWAVAPPAQREREAHDGDRAAPPAHAPQPPDRGRASLTGALAGREPRLRGRQIGCRHEGTSLVITPTGLAVGLALLTCATPHTGGDSPHGAVSAPLGSPAPLRTRRRGLGWFCNCSGRA